MCRKKDASKSCRDVSSGGLESDTAGILNRNKHAHFYCGELVGTPQQHEQGCLLLSCDTEHSVVLFSDCSAHLHNLQPFGVTYCSYHLQHVYVCVTHTPGKAHYLKLNLRSISHAGNTGYPGEV